MRTRGIRCRACPSSFRRGRRPTLPNPAKSLLLQVRVRRTRMRITSKGQVTIPVDIRERAGLLPHTEVEFEYDGKAVRIMRARTRKKAGRGARLVAHLRGR